MPSESLPLQGKVALVTGAGRNIGRAIALGLAAEGVRLVVVGRDAKQGEEVAKQARARGASDAIFVATDVTDRSAVEAMVAKTVERFGTVVVERRCIRKNRITRLASTSSSSSASFSVSIVSPTIVVRS